MRIDGVELNEGDRVLVTGQSPRLRRICRWILRRPNPPKQNGVYVILGSGWEKK